MTKLTRRAALGMGTSALTLSACTTLPAAKVRPGKVTFKHGVASGDPMSDRVIIWTRVTPENPDAAAAIPVRWEVVDPLRMGGLRGGYGTALATKQNDWCVKVDVTGLEPDAQWRYQFIVEADGARVTSPQGMTRTLAASGSKPVMLGVVSCSNFQFGEFNAYEHLAARGDVDVIVHLGDYFYEYGVDGYGGEVAKRIGREHDPKTEISSLADYRRRHAQYKSDPKLQAAHAAAPWICTWDDHESANNSYRTGAQNHDASEGSWTDRKQRAVQAYLE